MYNAELKQRFIRESYTNINMTQFAEMVFDGIEKHEILRDADICTFSKDEALSVVEEIVGSRKQSHHARLQVLKKYVSWCISNEVSNACDGILQIEEVGVSKLRRQTVANPIHLQRFLNCIFAKEERETIDCIYRAYYWLGYIGITEDKVLEILDTDVDLMNRIICFDGKEFPIYNQAFASIKICAISKSFNYEHPNCEPKIRNRCSGHNLLRGYTNAGSINKFRTIVTKRQKEQRFMTSTDTIDSSLDLQLSFSRVWLSGLFYRMYEGERAGIPPDFMPVAADFMDGRTYHLEKSGNLIGAKQRQIAKDYMNDYERWKIAYQM